jgi:hypothetical protein
VASCFFFLLSLVQLTIFFVAKMLGGWAAEERLLDHLQKAAEQNLAKDPAASESKVHLAEGKSVLSKAAKGDDLILDDSGEGVPEASLRAEAAALG